MSVSHEYMRHCRDLKQHVIDFAQSRKFERALKRAMKERFGSDKRVDLDEGEFSNFLDEFLLELPLPDGRTLVEHFLEAHPELPDADRLLLRGWQDVVEQVFEVRRRDGEALVAEGLVDELTYYIRSNMGSSAFDTMPPGSFVIARVVPVADEWMLSGVSRVIPATEESVALASAAVIALSDPHLVFRNPEKLAEGWRLQREDRADFVSFFGSDTVVLPAAEMMERLNAYTSFKLLELRGADGKTAAERLFGDADSAPPVPPVEFPDHVAGAKTIAAIYDEREGLHYVGDFDLVTETFADPELAADRRHRKAVMSYLEEPDIGPLVLRRLAERNPENASRLLRQLLGRADFSWSRDGEALLRQYKADWYAEPLHPATTPPLSERLANAALLPEPEELINAIAASWQAQFDDETLAELTGDPLALSSQLRLPPVADLRPLYNVPAHAAHVGRNDPCPCGSGKKYKRCCGR